MACADKNYCVGCVWAEDACFSFRGGGWKGLLKDSIDPVTIGIIDTGLF